MSKTAPFAHANAFLAALFCVTADYLEDIDKYVQSLKFDKPYSSLSTAEKFRRLMYEGQSFKSQGPMRTNFYIKVRDEARKVYR